MAAKRVVGENSIIRISRRYLHDDLHVAAHDSHVKRHGSRLSASVVLAPPAQCLGILPSSTNGNSGRISRGPRLGEERDDAEKNDLVK